MNLKISLFSSLVAIIFTYCVPLSTTVEVEEFIIRPARTVFDYSRTGGDGTVYYTETFKPSENPDANINNILRASCVLRMKITIYHRKNCSHFVS